MAQAVFIKNDPNDQNNSIMSPSGYSIPNHQQQFASPFGTSNDAIDPSDLSMHGNNGFMQYAAFNNSPQQNLSSSFNFGNSGIGTDELLDLEINPQNDLSRADGMNFLQQQQQQQDHQQHHHHNHGAGFSMSHPGTMTQMYSHTPDGAASIHSPFLQSSFSNTYEPFRAMNQPAQQHPPSQFQSPPPSSHFEHNYLKGKSRSSMIPKTSSAAAAAAAAAAATANATASTATAMGSLGLGNQESSSFPTQPIRAPSLSHRHQKNLSTQWDGTPGSAHSFAESPISSPGGGHMSHHAGISEVLKSGKHASLPAKVDDEPPLSGASPQGMESQEAKRRRRRASHNLVERRRRDNINDRIQDLSHLVPQHRLEDDKVRKQLVSNASMSSAGSNNPATSLLAGGNGRRATAGNITIGLPMDEKEKGPNKGDILNGAVSWMRDLMWALHVKMQQESELAEIISSLGGTWPFEQTEEEKRMRSEILDALERNDPNSFSYSRGPGSGLRVPKHTKMTGEPISGTGAMSPQSLSPPFNSGSGSGSGNGGANGPIGQGQAQYWTGSGHAGISFKEEDEYSMDMN